MTNEELKDFVVICNSDDSPCPMFYYNDEGYPHSCNLNYDVEEFYKDNLKGTKFHRYRSFPWAGCELVLSKVCKLDYWVNNGKKMYPRRIEKEEIDGKG